MKKLISVLLLVVVLLINITPVFAVNNQDLALEYSLKQSKSMCVVNSVAMMFRRQAIIDKNDNWKAIDESAIRNYKGNMDGIKIQNKVAYKNTALGLNMTANATCLYSMKDNGMKRNNNPQGIIDKLKEYLNKHPEGIALYVYKNNTDFTHAVLLTHYSGDEFYCIDPANSVPKGIINLKDSILTDSVRANSKDLNVLFSYAVKIWYVSDSSNVATKKDTNDNSSGTVKTEEKKYDNKSTCWWHISYNSSGYCKSCGTEYDMDVKNMSATTYQAVKNDVPVRNRPYSPEKITKWLSKGTKVTVVASGKNAAGNLWYKLNDGSWIYSKNLEKAKEAVPEASTLKISVTQSPTTINQGKSFGLRGEINSNYNVTSVKGYIINSNGKTVMSTSDSPNSKSNNIRYLNLNEDMIFGDLSAGNYTLEIVAKDSSGKSRSWSEDFTVKGEEVKPSTPANTSCSHSYNKSGYCSKCNKEYSISLSSMNATYEAVKNDVPVRNRPYSPDKIIKYLSKGTKVTVVASGKNSVGNLWYKINDGTWIYSENLKKSSSSSSSTSSAQTTHSSTSIKFELESMPKGNLPYGKSFKLKGWFRSDSPIVEARAYMLDSNKNVVMQSEKASSTTSNYKIQGYKLDKAMKFSELQPGGYYLKFYVRDANGDTATWISDKFYIVK